MPLLKRTPFTLLEAPEDLKPTELVYQIRFTKEVVRDYDEYLRRLNLYRERIWTCKVSGKGNMTYEEALVSEQYVAEKVHLFPKELMTPVLQIIQFSVLSLQELVNTILAKLHEPLLDDIAVSANCLYPCKMSKIDEAQYDDGLEDNKKINGKELKEDKPIRQKHPYSRNFLKSFIRDSTRQSCPWVLDDNLAQKHGISTDLPGELKTNFIFRDGQIVIDKKRKKTQDTEKQNEMAKEESIVYPIDDLLVQTGADDTARANRPSPSSDFNVPMDCVADLLMIWDFCSTFGRLLKLSPFSLQDFENAICHKESNPVLIVEAHASILRLLIKDSGEYFLATQEKKRKSKITVINWAEYLTDFLEIVDIPELLSCIATIQAGHYGFLDINLKLGILRELVAHVFTSDLFRTKLDENIEQRQALGATRREGAIEEARKKKEKERLKQVSGTNGLSAKSIGNGVTENSDHQKNLDSVEKKKIVNPSEENHALGNSEDKHVKEARKRTKEQMKKYFDLEMDKLSIRTNPLGKDRDYNKYWYFRRDERIFVGSSDFKQWGYYSTNEEIDALMGSLNAKGESERALHNQLKKYYDAIREKIEKRSREAAGQVSRNEDSVLRRSSRVRALPRKNPALAFLLYANKWKKDD